MPTQAYRLLEKTKNNFSQYKKAAKDKQSSKLLKKVKKTT